MALAYRILGRAARLYWRVRRPRTLGVRAIVLDPENRIALVRHTYAEHWYLPGGGVKKGESLVSAVHRELREEIAIGETAIERIVGVYHSQREAKDDHVVVFALRVSTAAAAGMRKADAMEIAEASWFTPDALPAGTSPATRRRIGDYIAGAVGSGEW